VARASKLGFAESNRDLGPKLLQLIAGYNAAAAPNERLKGVQFDIEPYVESSFWDNLEVSLQAYLWTLREPGRQRGLRDRGRPGVHQSHSKKLSFWWTGRAAFRQAAGELTGAYGGLPQFRGISVNDIDGYEAAGEYGRC
jgi:hypothetical protein